MGLILGSSTGNVWNGYMMQLVDKEWHQTVFCGFNTNHIVTRPFEWEMSAYEEWSVQVVGSLDS